MFLPLMELDSELNFVGMLADSVTTEDNLNFTVPGAASCEPQPVMDTVRDNANSKLRTFFHIFFIIFLLFL